MLPLCIVSYSWLPASLNSLVCLTSFCYWILFPIFSNALSCICTVVAFFFGGQFGGWAPVAQSKWHLSEMYHRLQNTPMLPLRGVGDPPFVTALGSASPRLCGEVPLFSIFLNCFVQSLPDLQRHMSFSLGCAVSCNLWGSIAYLRVSGLFQTERSMRSSKNG